MGDTSDPNDKPASGRKPKATGVPRRASARNKKMAADKPVEPAPGAPPVNAVKTSGAPRAKAASVRPSTAAAKPVRRRRRGPVSVVAKPAPKLARPAARKKAAPRIDSGRRDQPAVTLDADVQLPEPPPGLTEEERIEWSKYSGRGGRRLFEEERFLFPETYGTNRVRLLVKDPDWIFAYWDVDPKSRQDLRDELGERAAAVTQLTLRVCDAANGGMTVILLPEGARTWYVRTDRWRRAYRAELGLTLPSGEFRRLAESNLVVTPRSGPSPETARRVLTYHQAGEISVEAAREAAALDRPGVNDAPWSPAPMTWAVADRETQAERGGASDAFRR